MSIATVLICKIVQNPFLNQCRIFILDTRNITVKMPKRKVPRQTTTYRCLLFEFPQDQDYHIVATKPVIDNKHVMHHILLFGCDESGTAVFLYLQ